MMKSTAVIDKMHTKSAAGRRSRRYQAFRRSPEATAATAAASQSARSQEASSTAYQSVPESPSCHTNG